MLKYIHIEFRVSCECACMCVCVCVCVCPSTVTSLQKHNYYVLIGSKQEAEACNKDHEASKSDKTDRADGK